MEINRMVASDDSLPTDEQREMLRVSVRGYLEKNWPAEKALSLSADSAAVAALWRGLAGQGLTALGTNPAEGGLREMLLVMEELGQAACPAPLAGAFLTNLALAATANQAPQVAALLAGLEEGTAAVSWAFGSADGDANAGHVILDGDRVQGTLAFVEGAASATHVLAVSAGSMLIIAPRAAPGLTIVATPGLSVPPLAQVTFSNTPAFALKLDPRQVDDLNRVARLMLAARALGAARRGFTLVVDYANERKQFGQAIGKFQAIQHKLANCLIALEGVGQTLGNVAKNFDNGGGDWRYFASAALAYAGPALRQVALETHHTFGAVGYAEEHEAPRHFRRVHGDLTRHGGVRRAREELAGYLLDEGRDPPDLDLGASGNMFRAEVRQWLDQHWCGERRRRNDALPFAERGRDSEFLAAIGKQGWIALSWPEEHGGQARSPLEQLALLEELQRVDAPMICKNEIMAVALMKFGTPEQQAKYLPKIRQGESYLCLGYSEPGSGSDLASLKTTAVRDGDEWVINGQKIWTTGAEHADYMWLAARTDTQASPPHKGISVFIVPMNTPGITIHPSMAMYGHTFCNEFLDDVRVPADALIGRENDGWAVLTSALATERIIMGGFVAEIRANFDLLVAQLRGAAGKDDSGIRAEVGSLAAELEVARQLLISSIAMLEQGRLPIHEAAMSKTVTGELMERLGEVALDILGAGCGLAEGAAGAITNGRLEQLLRKSILMVVGGGTAEIQRNLIAQRGLGLAR